MPLLAWGINYIGFNNTSQLFLILWVILVFFVPVFFSTIEFGYFIKICKRDYSLFRLHLTCDDIKYFVFPALKRMMAYFVAAVIGIFLVKVLDFIK